MPYTLKKLITSGYHTPKQKQHLLHEIAESKGKQELFKKQSPEVLKRLLDSAVIESVRASTAMEGVAVPDQVRLIEMIRTARWSPRNRDEEDVLAYRNALRLIYENSETLSSASIVKLSNVLWAHDQEKAGLKRTNNEIALVYPDGSRVVRFSPPSAEATPALLEETCELYHSLIKKGELIDHQVISAFILDLLCIHPLEDGNGRLARILHTQLLLEQGYEAGRYVSLEGLVEKDKENYYDALYRSSQGWEELQSNPNPWMNFCLGKLNLVYKQLERQLEEGQRTFASLADRPEQGQVEKLLETLSVGQTFDRAFVEKETGVSGRTSRRVLRQWLERGRLVRLGAGRGTRYEKLR